MTETATMASITAVLSNTKFVIKSQTKPDGSEIDDLWIRVYVD
jgi:hypothetical protein